jgi:hypothetical protein
MTMLLNYFYFFITLEALYTALSYGKAHAVFQNYWSTALDSLNVHTCWMIRDGCWSFPLFACIFQLALIQTNNVIAMLKEFDPSIEYEIGETTHFYWLIDEVQFIMRIWCLISFSLVVTFNKSHGSTVQLFQIKSFSTVLSVSFSNCGFKPVVFMPKYNVVIGFSWYNQAQPVAVRHSYFVIEPFTAKHALLEWFQ